MHLSHLTIKCAKAGFLFLVVAAGLRAADGPLDSSSWIRRVEPTYPAQAKRSGLEGEVQVEFTIDETGHLKSLHQIGPGSAILADAVMEALAQSQLKSRPRNLPGAEYSVSRLCYEFVLPKNSGGEGIVRQVDFPEDRWRRNLSPAVYPYEMLKRKKGGYAVVSCVIGPDGRVKKVGIMEASRSEFGLAVQAQAETIQFPLPRDLQGRYQPRFQIIRVDFSIDGKGDVPVGSVARKLFLEPAGPALKVYQAAEVDQRPVPDHPLSPTFPSALAQVVPAGEAVIECLVDEAGGPAVIRIVSSTKREFGYAAAQAVSQWKFKPALRGGQPVMARALLSFDFKMQP